VYQVFFRTNVVIGIAERNTRALCQGPHRGLLITTLQKHGERRFEDERAGLCALCRFGDVGPRFLFHLSSGAFARQVRACDGSARSCRLPVSRSAAVPAKRGGRPRDGNRRAPTGTSTRPWHPCRPPRGG